MSSSDSENEMVPPIPQKRYKRWKNNSRIPVLVAMSSSDSENEMVPPIPQKQYKRWKNNSRIPVPLRTHQRWASKNKELQDDNVDIFTCDTSGDEVCDECTSMSSDSVYSLEEFESEIPFSEESESEEQSDSESDAGSSESTHNRPKSTLNPVALMTAEMYVKNTCWTKSSLQDILKLIQAAHPNMVGMPKTTYALFKLLREAAPKCDFREHTYCKKCLHLPTNQKCDPCREEDRSSFFSLDVLEQIRFMLEEENLESYFSEIKVREDGITDITDGTEYRRLLDLIGDENRILITLIVNTDGVAIVRSNSIHCWPIFISIAEVAQHLREKFTFLAGIWCDTVKPDMSMFLAPLTQNLQNSNLIIWTDPVTSRTREAILMAPLFVADAPARAQILNMLNFNGKFGCNICEIETEPCAAIEDRRGARFYNNEAGNDIQLRTDENIKRHAAKVKTIMTAEHCFGIKGLPVITDLPGLNLGTCVLPEYMHSVLLGVVHQMLGIWLERRGAWSQSRLSTSINELLLNITPIDQFNRLPRDVTLYNKYKASELQYWLLYYSVPCLEYVWGADNPYLQHWMLLVMGIHLLLKHSISKDDLTEAGHCLHIFAREMRTLYSDRDCSYNVHQLVHLPLCVQRWGPLWATSAFPFENLNGLLSRNIHGSKHHKQQIINNVKVVQGVTRLVRVRDLENKSSTTNKNFALDGKLVGAKFSLAKRILASLTADNVDYTQLKFFSKAEMPAGRHSSITYTSELYKKIRTNNYTVELKTSSSTLHYGYISFFYTNGEDNFMVLRSLTVKHDEMLVNSKHCMSLRSILPVTETETYINLPLKEIKYVANVIPVGRYICKRPNRYNKIL